MTKSLINNNIEYIIYIAIFISLFLQEEFIIEDAPQKQKLFYTATLVHFINRQSMRSLVNSSKYTVLWGF